MLWCVVWFGVVLATKPNIMFMVVDDLGWNDVGYHNPQQIRSQHFDRLSAEGIRLTDYNVFRFCSPSRSTFMTGRYPYHIGQQTEMNLNPTPGIACGINLNYTFMPALLKKAGYSTYALGKWHLGFLSDAYTPTYRGFDSYLGYYSGAEEHFTHEKSGEGYTAFDLANNTGKTVQPDKKDVGPNGTYSVYLYGNETVRLLRQHDKSSPFYMYLAWNVVHAPCQAPTNYINNNARIQNKGRRDFAAMMNAVDDSINTIVEELKAQKMWDNTILIVTTDNGGNLGGSGNNYPLRGGKYTFWQGGVRGIGWVNSPLLPSARRGTTWNGMMHAADWYPTIAHLAGVSPDNSGPMPVDGVNVWEALVANGSSPRDTMVLNIMSSNHEGKPHNTTGALRHGKWKLIVGYPGWKAAWDGWIQPPTFRDDDETPVVFGMEPKDLPPLADQPCATHCLYDVESDPTEHHDVSAQHPDIVSSMMATFNELKKSEVSVPQSGLCPTQYATRNDPRCKAKAQATGFWEPWL